MQNNETEQTNIVSPPTLKERIAIEAKKRAKELTDVFDLLELCHLDYLGFEGSDELEIVGVSKKGLGTTITVNFDDLTEGIRCFLEEKLPDKIAAVMMHEILSATVAEIDVTKLRS